VGGRLPERLWGRLPVAPDCFASADARFSLRVPGRERGKLPSTPPSSAIAGSLESGRPGIALEVAGAGPAAKIRTLERRFG